MKRTLLRALLLGALLSASAGSVAQGYDEVIPYYGNDPFVFCTFGVPADCWLPLNPVTGAFTVTNRYCFNPLSAAQYVRVCPHALISVGQVSQPGTKDVPIQAV